MEIAIYAVIALLLLRLIWITVTPYGIAYPKIVPSVPRYRAGDVVVLKKYANKIMESETPTMPSSQFWVIAEYREDISGYVMNNFQFPEMFRLIYESKITMLQKKE